MNLIKTTALLVTLSVFAMTSCGPKGASYKDSLKWIKDHYDKNEPERQHTGNKYKWDFTKTTGKDSQDFALMLLSTMIKGKVAELEGSQEMWIHSGVYVVAISPEAYEEKIGPIKDQCKFSFNDNELTITSEQDYPVSEEQEFYMKATIATKLDDKCFPCCVEFQFNDSTAKIGDKTYTVTGYLKTTFVFQNK